VDSAIAFLASKRSEAPITVLKIDDVEAGQKPVTASNLKDINRFEGNGLKLNLAFVGLT